MRLDRLELHGKKVQRVCPHHRHREVNRIKETEALMPKFLLKASYSTEGTKGLLKDGGSRRKALVEKVVHSLGGKVEAFYYAFGETDLYVIVELNDIVSAAAFGLAVNAVGVARISTVPLLTPEEVDRACSLEAAPDKGAF